MPVPVTLPAQVLAFTGGTTWAVCALLVTGAGLLMHRQSGRRRAVNGAAAPNELWQHLLEHPAGTSSSTHRRSQRMIHPRTRLRRAALVALAGAALAGLPATVAVARPITARPGTVGAATPQQALAGGRVDFDGDGGSDLVIGSPTYPTDHRVGVGAVQVVYGDGRKQSLTVDSIRDRAATRSTRTLVTCSVSRRRPATSTAPATPTSS